MIYNLYWETTLSCNRLVPRFWREITWSWKSYFLCIVLASIWKWHALFMCYIYCVVLSSPAGPNRHKSGVNRLFNTTISDRFAKRLSYVKSSYQCSHLGIALDLLRHRNMGSFLSIVRKLYSYIDSDVRNLRKIKYFRDYFRPSRKTWNMI